MAKRFSKTKSHGGRKTKGKLQFAHRGSSIGMRNQSTFALVERVEDGFSYSTLDRFQKASQLPMAAIAELIQLPPRTLSRRKEEGKLQPGESDRLLRASGLFEKALALFEGDRKAASDWLSRPQRALNNRTPLEFARTEVGAREVEDLIGRLEHGVFT